MRAIAWAFAAGLVAAGTAAADSTVPAGNPEAGANVFKKCMSCHRIGPDAKNSVGPVLNGIVGRPAGTYPDYQYSDANKKSGIVWDEATLARYLPNPQGFLPGTRMTFAGLPRPQDVADIIAYLKQFDDKGNKR